MSAVDCLVIGSGAGGAVTAYELARAGRSVLVLEEGPRVGLDGYGTAATNAMARLYRRRGMNPIVGRVPIGWVEGRVVGGSTEINSGFWHRTPPEVLARWAAEWGLEHASVDELAEHFGWAEEQLRVGLRGREWPASTKLFAAGIERMGWSYQEVPRPAPGCRGTNACASGCPTGAKQGMSRSLLPKAEAAGAQVLANTRVELLLRERGRVTGVLARVAHADGARELVRIDARQVFVAAGPTETPALLRRSGLKRNVGDTLGVHPMLKVVARFDDVVDAEGDVLPLLQVKEFWPEVSLGGAYLTPGHAAMMLSEDWPALGRLWQDRSRIAAFYVAIRGSGRGSVRPEFFGDGTSLRYELSKDDVRHLSRGFARLSQALLAAGAREVVPSAFGIAPVENPVQAVRWLEAPLPASALGLTTVHAFSSVPAGERRDRCAVDSFGRVPGLANLVVSDASILPDSPGVNPQGSVMAFARRNVLRFLAES